MKKIVRIFLIILIILNCICIYNFSSEQSEKSNQTSGKVVDTIVEISPKAKKMTKTEKEKYKESIVTPIRKTCNIKIPENEFYHSNDFHICNSKIHKCGFRCFQCECYCTLIVGHPGLHECIHGNIKNSNFVIQNYSAFIKKNNNYYRFIHGESAKIFLCDEYCKEQSQGHTHLFQSL